MNAVPIEVTRSVIWAVLPSTEGSGGTVFTFPSHDPASVFSLSNDFCASVCASFCARATEHKDSVTRAIGIKRLVFTAILLKLRLFSGRLHICAARYCYT